MLWQISAWYTYANNFGSRDAPILLFFSPYYSFQQFFLNLPILLNILLKIHNFDPSILS